MPGNPLLKGKAQSANNSKGNNGSNNGAWPEEDVLCASLMEYARDSDSLESRLQKLRETHGLIIGKTLLKKLNRHYDVPSVRKAIPREVADQQILNEMADDANNYRGPATVQHNLALAGFKISRRIVRETMLLNDPDGVDARYPSRKKIRRAQLKAHGTWQEIHCDGHEKLGSLALQMGGVGLPIYGMKDKWEWGNTMSLLMCFWILLKRTEQITTDNGSETGNIIAIATGLKTAYAPDVDLARYPAFVVLKSTNNTPIESLWHWFQDQCGKNLHLQVTKGRDEGIFNPNNQIHVHLFNWIWPPIVQGELDHLTARWNSHVIRRPRNKLMPSGVSPNDLYAHPEHYGGRCFAIPVPQAAVNAFRDSIRIARDAALSWVPAEFDAVAGQVYELLGSPECSAETAWDLFSKMASVMR
ncbi:hypothetical protein C8J57DRAFT_1246149 [Mycena rebaudengoi]|nr:hypothetical protein C8J57DRAFT_1246149 [Mycena rebaudengoi]